MIIKIKCKKCGQIFEIKTMKTQQKYCYICKRIFDTELARIHNKKHRALMELKSNGCSICGYNKYSGALDFHHVEPSEKIFLLSQIPLNATNQMIADEICKCILLCKNCHAEVEHADKI